MVFKREVEGDIKALKDAKIVAFSCPLDSMATETKVRWVIRLKNVYSMCRDPRNWVEYTGI